LRWRFFFSPTEPFVPTPRGKPVPVVFVLFFASGATGLVYQVLWLRQLTLIFGATAYATSAILSTFMGGLALGSYWAGRRADLWRDPPLRTYGKLELGITAYAVAIPWLLDRAAVLLELAWKLGADRHFALLGIIKFIAIAILILPATTMMGATLPVVSRIAAEASRNAGARVGALYAMNTLGAVVGTVGAAFVALPALGMKRTLAANLTVNALVGGVAWFAGRRSVGADVGLPESAPQTASDRPASRALVLAFAASGCAAMLLEVAWTRSLALVLGSSVYAYASMLTAFLLGLAAGAGSAAYFLEHRPKVDSRTAVAVVLAAAGLLSFAAAHTLQALPRLFAEIYFRLSPSPEGWWIAQLGIALLVMFPTTYALGWVFPLVLDAVGGGGRRVASSVGRIYAANTVGTIVGAVCGGFVLVPLLGVGATLLVVAVGQLLLGAALPGGSAAGASRRRAWAAACVALALACIAWRPGWNVLVMNSGVYTNIQGIDASMGWDEFRRQFLTDSEVVFARDGLTASIVVAKQVKADNLYLAVNGKIDASSRVDLETQVMAGHVPLLFHPAPRDVLIVGLATGITVASAATHSVERVRVVEVEGAMLEAARRFGQYNRDVLDDPRVTVSINDARNELQFNAADYDVIVSEPSNPWMTVAANLFTEDFFRLGRSRLRPGGVFGQWIQTYSLTPGTLRSILAGFHRAFPNVLVFETLNGVDLLVIGSDHPLVLDFDELERRSSDLWVRADLARIGVGSSLDLAGMLQGGGRALDDLVRGARVNTDDNGLVEFAAPRTLYLDSQDANMAMLQGGGDDPLALVASLVQTRESPERLRLEMVRRWARREQKPRAARAASFLEDPVLKAEANEILGKGRWGGATENGR
jgi:spermidine synthase